MVKRVLVTCMPFVLALQGCASIVSGGDKNVTFTSEPGGARVMVVSLDESRYQRLETPETVLLPREKSFIAMYELDGHHTVTVPVVSGAGQATLGSAVGNLLLGGVILFPVFMVVDAASGAAYSLPEKVHTDLKKSSDVAPPNAVHYKVVLERIREIREEKTEKAKKSHPGSGAKTKGRRINQGSAPVWIEDISKDFGFDLIEDTDPLAAESPDACPNRRVIGPRQRREAQRRDCVRAEAKSD